MPDAYVYITLPNATLAVTAGRFEHRIDRSGVASGRFVYGRRYRERKDAVEIDPVELRLDRGAIGVSYAAPRPSHPFMIFQ